MTDTLAALRRGGLAGARTLTLREGLTEFPREILGLADTLEVLDLAGNALDRLPPDFARLHRLQVLFCSHNRFEVLPPVLGDCASLAQVGFRATGLCEIPAEALPARLRWLTVTDNRLESVPAALGERPALQKLMLAGNRLRALPERLAEADGLELLRLSANRFEALPPFVSDLPALAWLAWSGNPLDLGRAPSSAPRVDWRHVRLGGLLGEGASGRIHAADWAPDDSAPPRAVALKLFRGAMTSDGLPEAEIAACLAAGDHPNLTGALGRLVGHPDGLQGLALRRLPAGWQNLAGPPSLASCSRDVYAPSAHFTAHAVVRIAGDVAAATAHLHARGLLHGDLYAHNILWDGEAGRATLSDFGAASFLPEGAAGEALQRLDVRAWGLLLGELLDRMPDAPPALRRLELECVQRDPAARPLMPEVVRRIDARA